MSGELEGAFGWVTANYIGGTLGPMVEAAAAGETAPTLGANFSYGALDMGGASTQITFVPTAADFAKLAPGDAFTTQLYGANIHLYTHSYLCYGLKASDMRHQAHLLNSSAAATNNSQLWSDGDGDLAQLLPAPPANNGSGPGNGTHGNGTHSIVLDDPCLPRGYNLTLTASQVAELRSDFCTANMGRAYALANYTLVGTSDAAACEAVAKYVISHPPPGGQTVGAGQPPLQHHFLAFSGFYYFVQFMCSTQRTRNPWCPPTTDAWTPVLSDVRKGINGLCAENYSTLHESDPTLDDSLLTTYCYRGQVWVLGAGGGVWPLELLFCAAVN